MNIPEKLQAYLENEFNRMIQDEEKLKIERTKHRRKKDRRRKEISRQIRSADTDDTFKYRHYNYTQSLEENLKRVIKEETDAALKDIYDPTLQGKSRLDFNNFVYTAYYLIKEHNSSETDASIYRWVATFLSEKNYLTTNNRPYDSNDVARVISDMKKDSAINHINSLIDDTYQTK